MAMTDAERQAKRQQRIRDEINRCHQEKIALMHRVAALEGANAKLMRWIEPLVTELETAGHGDAMLKAGPIAILAHWLRVMVERSVGPMPPSTMSYEEINNESRCRGKARREP